MSATEINVERSYTWPVRSLGERGNGLKLGELEHALRAVKGFWHSGTGILLIHVLKQQYHEELNTLREHADSTNETAKGEALKANARLDVLELLLQEGFGFSGELEKMLDLF